MSSPKAKPNKRVLAIVLALGISNVITLALLSVLTYVHYRRIAVDWANTKELSEVIKNFFEVAGLVTAAIWTYYLFIRGRVVKERLELTLVGRLQPIDGRFFLVTTGKVTNVGTTDFKIQEDGACVRIAAYPAPDKQGIYTPKESHCGTFSIFPRDKLLEPGESIQNERITTIDHEFAAIGIELFIRSAKRTWYASSIVEKSGLEAKADGRQDTGRRN